MQLFAYFDKDLAFHKLQCNEKSTRMEDDEVGANRSLFVKCYIRIRMIKVDYISLMIIS
jgi:hypothetical protein